MNANASPVRIAVIGAGLIGHRHVQHIVDEPRCRLAGIVDPSPQAKALAERVGTIYYSDIARIYAESSNAIRQYPVEDTVVITIRFRSGVLGTIVTSDVVASPYNFESATGENPLIFTAAQDCYRIFGTEATLNFPEMTLWRYTGEGEQGWSDPISHERTVVEHTIPFERQLQHFCDLIRHSTAPRCSGEEGIKTLEATLAVRESVRTGEPVTFD